MNKRTYLGLVLVVASLAIGVPAHAQPMGPTPGGGFIPPTKTGGSGGTGDITSVGATAGGGLTGGATSGAAYLGLIPCSLGEILKWGGTSWGCAADATGGGITDGDKGDITASSSGVVWTIDNNVVSLAKMADIATARILGRTAAGTGDPEELTAAQVTAMLDAFTSGAKGLAPASGGGTTNYLRADGSWAAPPNTLGSDGDKGDITVGGTGTTLTIDSQAVTLAKMANLAASRFIGRVTASTGVPEAMTGTQATTLLDVFTSALKGLVPASGGGTTNYLRADGTWAAPPGTNPISGLTSGRLPKATSSTAIGDSIVSESSGAISVAGTSSAPLSVTTTNTATTDTVFTGTRTDTGTAGDQTAIAIGQGSAQAQLVAETVNTSDLGAKFRLNTRWFNGSTYSNPNDIVVSGGSVGINQDISGLTYALQVSKSVNNTRAALFDGATVVTGGYLSVPNGNGTTGGYQIDGADTLYRGTVDGHLYLRNPYNVAGGGAYDIIVEPSSSDGSIRFRTNAGTERLRISDGGTITLTGNLTANGTTGTTGQVLKIVSGSPQWSADASGLGSQTITTTGTYDDYALSPETTTITSTSAGTVTLRSMTGGVAGRCVNIINAGASVLDIAHDGGGTTTNRFALSGNVSWRQHVNEIVTACYGADDRWHIDRTRQIGAPFVTTTSASIGTTLGVTGNTSLQGSVNTIGDANTDTMVVNAGSTFNHTVVLGDATADQTDLKSRLTDTASGVTLSSCGTSPSRTTGTNAFTITVGTGTATSCTVAFATAYANEPTCSVTRRDSAGRTDIYFSSRTASGFTWTNAGGANMAGQLYDVICVGH